MLLCAAFRDVGYCIAMVFTCTLLVVMAELEKFFLLFFFFLMIRRPPRSTQSRSSAASDVYKRQVIDNGEYLDIDVCNANCSLIIKYVFKKYWVKN